MRAKYLDYLLFTNDKVSFYVGKKAGEKIQEEIKNAKKSVTILSPFISQERVDELIELFENKGIEVNLIFSENDKPLKEDDKTKGIIKNLIEKTKELDKRKGNYACSKKAQLNKDRSEQNDYKSTRKVFTTIRDIVIFLTISLISFFLYNLGYPSIGLVVFVIFILVGLIWYYIRTKTFFKNKMFFSYNPKKPSFRFAYLLRKNYNNEHTFMHCKYYVIDDKVFVGSLNFTNDGFFNNIETVITLKEPKLAKNIRRYTNGLFGKGTKVNHHNIYKDCYLKGKDYPLKVIKSLESIVYDRC